MRSTSIARWPAAPPTAISNIRTTLEKVLQATELPKEQARFTAFLRTYKGTQGRAFHYFQSTNKPEEVVIVTTNTSRPDSRTVTTFPHQQFMPFLTNISSSHPDLKWDMKNATGFNVGREAAVYSLARGDWIVRVGNLETQGNPGQYKGLIVELEYTPLPYLPPTSPFFEQFFASLLPPGNGWHLLSPPDADLPEEKSEWTLSDTAQCYVEFAVKEGLA
ncbi:hypothetical protein BT69DRAFT_1334126 [Atractiella rhizophila]|nr:hypothetical protein BT69DRAFT_1334126 [Atractiella rhizophila]